jgi:hypothetical protein
LATFESDDLSGMLRPDEARAILNTIADAWLQRQAKVKCFKYTWRRDGERKTINTLSVDGEKFMTEFKTSSRARSSSSWARPRVGGLKQEGGGCPIRQTKRAFDGNATRTLSVSDNPESPREMLHITSGFDESVHGLPGVRCAMLALRSLHANIGQIRIAKLRDPAKFRVRARKGQIGDVACVVIETEPHPGMQVSYWLDPARDYIPLREHRTLNGEDQERLDISYGANPACGWAPVGWRESIVGSGGTVLSVFTDTITEFTINQPIPASDFQIETPPGAKVQDWRIGGSLTRRNAARSADAGSSRPE